MSAAADLLLRLRADGSQAVRELGRVGSTVEGLGHTVGRAAVLATAAIAGLGVAAVREFAAFEKGMREVFTLLPGWSAEALGALSEDAKALAIELGIIPDKVIPALYEAISAGVPGSNVIDFLRVAGKAAIGGVTEIETAVDGLTTVVNSYGAEVLDVKRASDIMFVGIKLGKTTMEELAGFLFQVVPVAAAANISFEEIVATVAALTAQGTPTRVAATQIRTAIVELGKTGTVAFDVFAQATGETFPEFIAGGGTIVDALAILSDEARRMGTVVQNMFGSVEGGMAATALTSESGLRTVRDFLAQTIDSAGATDQAFQTMEVGVARSWDRLKARIDVALIDTGEQLAPVVSDFLDAFGSRIPGAIAGTGEVLVGIVGWLETVGSGLGQVVRVVSGMPGPLGVSAVGAAALAGGLLLAASHPVIAGLAAVAGLLGLIGAAGAEASREADLLATSIRAAGEVTPEALFAAVGEKGAAAFEKAGGSVSEFTRLLTSNRARAIEYGQAILANNAATGASLRENSYLVAVLNQVIDRYDRAVTIVARYATGTLDASNALDDFATRQAFLNATLETGSTVAADVESAIQQALGSIGAAGEQSAAAVASAVGAFAELPEAAETTVAELKAIFTANLKAHREWAGNLALLTRLGMDDLVVEFEALGPAYAAVLSDLLATTENVSLLSEWEAQLDSVDDIMLLAGQRWAALVAAGWGRGPSLPVDDPGPHRIPRLGDEAHLAGGGTLPPGRSALVGERGLERIRAMSGGGVTVTPLTSGGGGGGVTVYVTVSGSVTTERELVEAIRVGLLDLGDHGT